MMMIRNIRMGMVFTTNTKESVKKEGKNNPCNMYL